MIFDTKQEGRFKSYSRSCPSTVKRQPVILTQQEKDRIDKLQPDSYDKETIIKYGSSEDNQHYFICPRYWCLTTDMPLTEKDIKDGKCGGEESIIPRNAKTVPPGKYIYEFYSKQQHDVDGEYAKQYPGYMEGKINKNGFCSPCCFKTPPSDPKRLRIKNQCEINKTDNKISNYNKKTSQVLYYQMKVILLIKVELVIYHIMLKVFLITIIVIIL